jgi:hypothetical protein
MMFSRIYFPTGKLVDWVLDQWTGWCGSGPRWTGGGADSGRGGASPARGCYGSSTTAEEDKEAATEPSVGSPCVQRQCRGGTATVKLRRWRASTRERWRARKNSRVRCGGGASGRGGRGGNGWCNGLNVIEGRVKIKRGLRRGSEGG